MLGNFPNCDRETRKWEGGDVNHPKDPGGLTSRGVTAARGAEYRKKHRMDPKVVTKWSEAEVDLFYKYEFWSPLHGDDLPLGVDLSVYDFGVNSGCSRSVKKLPGVLGTVQVDGKMGPNTLMAIQMTNPARLIKDHCAARLGFLQALKIWNTFGKGWGRRVAGIRAAALGMVLPVVEMKREEARSEEKAKTTAGGAVVTGGGATGGTIVGPPEPPPGLDLTWLWWGGMGLFAFIAFGLAVWAILHWQQAQAIRAVANNPRG